MAPETRVEFENLLSALCDQQISDAEFARLQELLCADAECRRIYLDYLDMHASLLSDPPLTDSSHSTGCGRPSEPAEKSNAAAHQPKEGLLHWGRGNIRHALLVLGTLVASLLVQLFWLPPLFSDRDGPAPIAPKADALPIKKGIYVATLVRAVDCVWDSPRDPGGNGSRLAPGKYRLPRGVASIRFDGGPELILEGPAEINLESATAVTVMSGKVVFRTTDADPPFDLRTPNSTLVDLASEGAVSVSPEAEEIYVFEGELQRISKKSPEPESLKAGEARRYEPQSLQSAKATIDPKLFVRHVVDPSVPVPEPANALLAYEGFDYKNPLALQNGKATGGIGWSGPWRASTVFPGPKAERERFSLNIKDSLTRSGASVPSVGGSFDYAGLAKTYRKLATGIHLDSDGTYFLSFLFRRQGAPAEHGDSLSVQFWSDDDYQQQNFLDHRKRLHIGVKGSNQLYTNHQRMAASGSMPLNNGSTYLLVAKIAASRSSPDQVFLRVYGREERVESEETGRWSVQSPLFRSDRVFDWIELQMNGKSRQTIDEIRLGTSWASVTAPWTLAKKD